MAVAIATAIPSLPFTKRFGNLAGKTTGSNSSSEKFKVISTIFLSKSFTKYSLTSSSFASV